MKRFVPMALVLALGACAHAHPRPPQLKNAPDTTVGTGVQRAYNTGVHDGMYSAATTHSPGNLATGFTLGLLFPIPGPLGECLIPRRASATPPGLVATATQRGPDYLSGYQKGYADQSGKSKKQEGCMASLAGATLAFAIISALMMPR